MGKPYTIEQIRNLSDKTHGNKYIVLSVIPTDEKNQQRRLKILCTDCGETFIKYVSDHIKSTDKGRCPHCIPSTYNFELAKKELDDQFGSGRYRIIKSTFTSYNKPATIWCTNCMIPNEKKSVTELKRSTSDGYANCCPNGFNPSKPAILYYFKYLYNGKEYYKIGITNRTIYERFKKEVIDNIFEESIIIKKFDLGQDAHNFEKEIKSDAILKNHINTDKGVLFGDSGDINEVFIKDISEIRPEYFKSFSKGTVHSKAD